MASIVRLRVTLTGTPVTGGGLNVTHWAAGSTSAPAAMNAFWTACATFMPNGITISVPNTGDTINDATGQIDGVWTASGGGTITSSGGATSYAQGVGGRVYFFTDGITRGRRVRGEIFVVPVIASSYQSDGTLTSTISGALQTAATTLAGVAAFGVYTRPQPGLSNGAFHDVLAGIGADNVTWLRSRRT